MRITRRQFGATAGAAVLLRNAQATAAQADVLVPGWDLPGNIDPHQVLDVPAENVAFNLYDNLYRYEDNPPKIEPWLAESHTVSPDGMSWEFKLRPGVKFHDGSPVTAAMGSTRINSIRACDRSRHITYKMNSATTGYRKRIDGYV